jgi:phospholipid/cholesterol/gamma-HCH transport system ATP-binding protein
MADGTPLIRFADVHKRFGSHDVLAGVTLEIRRGETMVIIGRSGCGKSVLLKHMIGLLRPDRGEIHVDGREITGLAEEDLVRVRARFGMVFQGAALFDSLTVAENVGFGLRRQGVPEDRIAEVVEERLRQVGLPGVGGKKPAELSGGMKKRVGLARALAQDPEVILYDEPTTGLDPIMADAINDLILETQERLGVTSVVVTHDMVSAYKVGRRIAMLYRGGVRIVGTPDEIRESSDEVVRQFIAGRAHGPIEVHTLA